MALDFAHLHVHTRYSKADGAISIPALAKKLSKLGQKACAITDHGNMSGVIYMHDYMKQYGIKPIMGYESYTNDNNAHLILLAKTNEGFKNLIKICSIENLLGWVKSGKFAKGNLDLEEVKKAGLGKGIIALTACLGGTTSRRIMSGDIAGAEDYVRYLQGIFEEVYIELQHNTVPEQIVANYGLLDIAGRLGLKCVITKDAHYLDQNDWEAHDVLLAKQINKPINDPNRWKFPGGPEYYICDSDEMERYCKQHNIPLEVITNTMEIADKCNVDLFGKDGVYNSNLFPDYDDVPEGFTQNTYLRKLAMDGLINFIETRPAGYKMDVMKYINRLNYELDVIDQTGFAGYFLILWDFMKYCSEYRDATHPNGIGTGAGRGSGVGSLVCRSLNITKVDPIKYNLLFERFLNPERKSAPDVDLDVSDLDRPLVIEYMLNKYGKHRVGQIITSTQFKVAGGSRDVLRLLDKSKKEQDEICKLIEATFPDGSATNVETLLDLVVNPQKYEDKFGDKLQGAIDIANRFHEVVAKEPWVVEIVSKLEGTITGTGVHAGGVLVFPGESSNYAPMSSELSSKAAVLPVCQYDMKIIDKLGILKLDILGLTTSRVIAKTADDVGIDINNIDLEDDKVFQMLREGHTVEVFQFEGGGMTKAIIDSKVCSIEDLIAIVSLYRPGPLDAVDPDTGNTIYNTYIECCKNGYSKQVHPRLEPILSPSKGNMIYQEQIMQVVMEMGNCTLGYADIVRRGMGKKDRDLMAKMRNEFMYGLREYDKDENHQDVYNINNPLILKPTGEPIIVGACNNGFTEKEASDMWSVIEIFARYAFNKSHAAAYGLNAYQTAFLKYHYPAEFMANALTACDGDQKEIIKDIRECKRLGVLVLPPDVNKSDDGFTVETMPDGRKAIRFGIGAIKGISKIEGIKAARAQKPFDSVTDFFTRVSGREINRSKAESLILAGAFDDIRPNRHEVYNYYFKNIRKENPVNENTYLAMKDNDKKAYAKSYIYRDPSTYCSDDALAYEKELIGMYVSGHPLDKYDYTPWDSIWMGASVECFAIIKDLRIQQNARKQTYAFFKAETLGDMRDCVMWGTEFAKYGDRLAEGRTVCIRGEKSTNQRGDDQLRVSQVLVKVAQINQKRAQKANQQPPSPPPSSISETHDPLGDLFATSYA